MCTIMSEKIGSYSLKGGGVIAQWVRTFRNTNRFLWLRQEKKSLHFSGNRKGKVTICK